MSEASTERSQNLITKIVVAISVDVAGPRLHPAGLFIEIRY